MTGNIVNGVPISIATYPYYALITKRDRVHCGGAIVSDRVILTAGHCFLSNQHEIANHTSLSDIVVHLGSERIHDSSKYSVCRIYAHENYSSNHVINDVGLIILSRNIKFGRRVQKARLIDKADWRDKAHKLTVMGHGVIETNSPLSDVLRVTVMKYVPNDVCDRTHNILAKGFLVPSTMFCMIGERWTSDCYGDSGSPAIWRGYVVGLVNLGRESFCGSEMIPTMYLDVYQYRDWITKNIRELEKTDPSICSKKRKSKKKSVRSKNIDPVDTEYDPTDWLT